MSAILVMEILRRKMDEMCGSGDVVAVKVRDLIKRLEADGWYLTRMRVSHRQYKHRTNPGLVTVSGKPSDDVPVGTLNNILKQAQLEDKP